MLRSYNQRFQQHIGGVAVDTTSVTKKQNSNSNNEEAIPTTTTTTTTNTNYNLLASITKWLLVFCYTAFIVMIFFNPRVPTKGNIANFASEKDTLKYMTDSSNNRKNKKQKFRSQQQPSKKVIELDTCDNTKKEHFRIVSKELFANYHLEEAFTKWNVWDGCNVIEAPKLTTTSKDASPVTKKKKKKKGEIVTNEQCDWVPHRPKYPSSSTMKEGKICLYKTPNFHYMNHIIKTTGHWPECSSLVELWNENSIDIDDIINTVSTTTTDTEQQADESSSSNSNKNSYNKLYIEVGTHFGACIMEMLLSTNATIVAFESDDTNLHQVTSTLLTLPKEIRNRVALFPIAVGHEEIHIHKHNIPNATATTSGSSSSDSSKSLFRSSTTKKKQKEEFQKHHIFQTTLDNIFEKNFVMMNGNKNKNNDADVSLLSPSSSLSIPILKIDAFGLGCNILYGGTNVIKHTQSILKFTDVMDDNTDITMNHHYQIDTTTSEKKMNNNPDTNYEINNSCTKEEFRDIIHLLGFTTIDDTNSRTIGSRKKNKNEQQEQPPQVATTTDSLSLVQPQQQQQP